jgi:hyperosmotically inducible protein
MKVIRVLIGGVLGAALLGPGAPASAQPPADGSADTDEPRAQKVTDASISMKLKTQYWNTQGFKHAHIAVTTTNGVVTLFGMVPTIETHQRALEIARSTAGVRAVNDQLEIDGGRLREQDTE